jgi:hypothetical protein
MAVMNPLLDPVIVVVVVMVDIQCVSTSTSGMRAASWIPPVAAAAASHAAACIPCAVIQSLALILTT